jgi:hypothetical protein
MIRDVIRELAVLRKEEEDELKAQLLSNAEMLREAWLIAGVCEADGC